MEMAGLENVAIYGRFRSSPAEVLGPELCRFLDAGNNEALGTLSCQASKKRQGTKSREVGTGWAADEESGLGKLKFPARGQRTIRKYRRFGGRFARRSSKSRNRQ
jgi:hypothetical protein